MHLAKIKIENFRIFQNLELILNSGLNIIVGENNSGKTALVEAIRYVLGTKSGEWIQVTENDFHADSTQFSIQLKFEDISPNQASVFVEHLTHELITKDNGDGAKKKAVLYVNFEAILTERSRRGFPVIKTELKSGSKDDGPRIESEIRNYLSATYLKPLRDAEAELAAGRGSRLSQILSVTHELSQNPDNIGSLIEALVRANKEIVDNPGVISSLVNIEGLLKKLIFENDQFKPAIDILGGKDIAELSDLEKTRTFKSILEKLSLSLDIDNPLQGLGYNNLLFIATELLLLSQEQDEFPILLIEEPEAHLHPQLQLRLLKFIREDYNQGDNPKLQTILTTHSPNIASKAPLESLIIMTKDGRAFPLRKGETELEDDDYIFLEKFLDVTKSNLFFAKAVIMVEGDGENILLPTIAELLERPLENYGVSVVNIGNTAFSRYAKIFKRKNQDDDENKDNWVPIEVACMRDLDLWPDKAEDIDENIPFGFKVKKQPNEKGRAGNLHFWLTEKTGEELTAYKENKQSLGGQNIRVFLSDEWTFEYSLALKGLAVEVYEAVNNNTDGFDDLPENDEEKAIYIYKLIDADNAKTRVAYNLVQILIRNYKEDEKQNELRLKLPKYIIDTIEYVTEPFDVVAPVGKREVVKND